MNGNEVNRQIEAYWNGGISVKYRMITQTIFNDFYLKYPLWGLVYKMWFGMIKKNKRLLDMVDGGRKMLCIWRMRWLLLQ